MLRLSNLPNSYKFIFLYIFTHYIIQIFIHLFFKEQLSFKYTSWDYSPIYVILSIMFFLFVFKFVDDTFPRVKFMISLFNTKLILNIIKLLFLIFFSISSLYFIQNFGIDFRHSNRLNNTGFLIQILVFLRVIAMIVVFFYITALIRNYKLTFGDRIYLLILLISYLLCITGSLHVILIPILLCLIFLSNSRLKTFLNLKLSFLYICVLLLFFFITGLCVVLVGVGNKIGMENAFLMFFDLEKINYLISMVSMRISTSYFSLLLMAKDNIFNFELQSGIYFEYIETFIYRLQVFIPIYEYSLDEVKGINRHNYLLLFQNNTGETTGAGPGLIGSIYYMPYFPFNFVIISLYLVIIFRLLNVYIGNKNLNFISVIILFYFIYGLLSSPIMYLSIIQPSTIYLVIFIIGTLFINNKTVS